MSSFKTCPESCSITFPKTCSDTCLKTCSWSETYPETCSFTFPKTCSDTGLKTCSWSKTCPGTCSITFPKTCSDTSVKTCSETSSETCSFTFPKTCSDTSVKTCSETSSETCSFTFPKTCSDTGLKTCSWSKTCPGTCSITFPKTCSDTSVKTCSETSSETCSFTFPKTCSDTGLKTCSWSKTCPGTCSITFPKTCSDTSVKTCSETSSETCSITFPKTCSDTSVKTCSETSSETCSITFPKTCSDTSVKTCSETTSETCSVSNPKSSFSSFSMTSKSIIGPLRCGIVAPKAYSVYGCGFGEKTRISTCSYRLNACSPCAPFQSQGGRFGARIMTGGCYDYLQKSDKASMQNLNDRLASYLDKVRFLEAANATLEKQIREDCEKKGLICQRDYSCYFKTIDCLQEKIKDATVNNGKILLQIDNTKLAAEDFKIKYENEATIRQCVKADVDNLRCILEKTCQAKADLEMQICALQEELVYLKKTHQEDVAALLCQLTDTKVCVEVDAAPQQDLNKVLEEMRCHYETIIDKHRREQECWFKVKMTDLCKDAATNTECLETSISQISDLRRTLQSLEIELQSQISKKGALECSLLETEARYSTILAGFQKQINAYEAELCQVRSGIEQQGRDYAALLDIKSRLEQEIATYRCLMEKQEIK
ncbi:hypothetical protein G5714_012012 [Onychostoma macrolepis]|uniref:IF rod domain-containing protein n=2 Tax=Onychostoma macrolepis TaxID=369639 RepID=A0A7J6CJZ2_9TELE|nr:hypothetical protein G5714_012012 [Onychostoma macrolepis]